MHRKGDAGLRHQGNNSEHYPSPFSPPKDANFVRSDCVPAEYIADKSYNMVNSNELKTV